MLSLVTKGRHVSTFDPKDFGRKLRAAREELEITQEELSRRSVPLDGVEGRPISTPYISVLERGARYTRPTLAYLDAIARGLRHKDSSVVYEWAGVDRDPDYSTLLNSIRNDHTLMPGDRKLIEAIYLRLVGQG